MRRGVAGRGRSAGRATLVCAGLLAVAGCGPPEAGRESRPGEDASASVPGTARSGAATYRSFVRLASGADPAAVAERHGIRPDTVLSGRVRGFRASLTRAEAERLRRDSAVRSVSVRVEDEEWTPGEGRTVPRDPPADTGGASPATPPP